MRATQLGADKSRPRRSRHVTASDTVSQASHVPPGRRHAITHTPREALQDARAASILAFRTPSAGAARACKLLPCAPLLRWRKIVSDARHFFSRRHQAQAPSNTATPRLFSSQLPSRGDATPRLACLPFIARAGPATGQSSITSLF